MFTVDNVVYNVVYSAGYRLCLQRGYIQFLGVHTGVRDKATMEVERGHIQGNRGRFLGVGAQVV